MENSFITIDGVRLCYVEQNRNESQCIVFIHGNSLSKRFWYQQMSSPLLAAYHLIAIDLPAHGSSDANPSGDYSLPAVAQPLSKAVTRLVAGKPYIVTGISLGTNIIAEMLPFGITPVGLALAGACLAGKGYAVDSFILPDTHVGVVFTDAPPAEEVEVYFSEGSYRKDEKDKQLFTEDFNAVKSPFRSSLGGSIAAGMFSDEVALVREKNMPVLVIFGKNEAVINPSYLDNADLPLWKGKVYKLEGASHLVNIDQPEAFNNLLAQFAAQIFK